MKALVEILHQDDNRASINVTTMITEFYRVKHSADFCLRFYLWFMGEI